MNDPLRSELERLKERQAQLHHGVDLLGVHIAALEKRIAQEEAQRVEVKRVEPVPAVPLAVPPLLSEVAKESVQPVTQINREEASNAQVPTEEVSESTTLNLEPAAAGQSLTPSPSPLDGERVSEGRERGAVGVEVMGAQSSALPPIAFQPAVPPPMPAPAKPESFEMRLGTYWLVRIGIVAMLTALVFFGSYAYQNYIGKLGPGGKVALLYLASGALLGFGAWFQRRAAKESLRNYAQVLLAGGMAAVYFTTYAAHHFPHLQVIASKQLDGLLLLGWAAVMAWTADRKKSEVFAMFAIGLAFYSSVITRVGYFTLYSNLVLAAAVLFFLVRNRWAKLSFASLVATYASYGFWRFYVNESWQWAGSYANADLLTGVGFLAAYWAVFTAAVFLSQHKEFAGVNRASFITLNNAAFYVLFLLTMWQVQSGGFWRFNVITGVVLLGAAAFAKIRLRDEPLAANTYFTQGLLLVTVGIIARFMDDHSTLALALALESVVLWLTGTMRKNIIMRTGACVSAAVATLAALDSIKRFNTSGAWLGAGVGALLAFNAFWAHWREQRNNPSLLRASPAYFSVLALLLWTVTILQNAAVANNPAMLALVVLVLVASVHLTRLRELSLLAQLLMPLAALLFVVNQLKPEYPEPWWVFACVGSMALALVHWWQKQNAIEASRELRVAGQFVPALILVGVTVSWLQPKLDLTQWVLFNSVALLALTAYGAVTRNWVLALVAQIFGGIAVVNFVFDAGGDALPWLPGLAPLAALTVLALAARRWAEVRLAALSYAGTVRNIAVAYGRVAMGLLIWWTFQYVPQAELVWSFTALGVVSFALAGWRKNQDFLVFATVLNIAALACLAYQILNGTSVYWPNFVAVLAWMVEQQIARREVERYPVPAMAHNLAMIGAGTALWVLISRWVVERGFTGCFYLTASWSLFAFAIIALGAALRERMYRWLGLVIIGCAVGRVVIFDVWHLETIYRIVSFFALGAVLLVLGFIYNKYQERLREWL